MTEEGEKKLNIYYFNKIDSPEKAYFLGLLYTDGYLNEKANAVEIGLQNKDCYILEAFEKAAEIETSIRKLKKKEFSILAFHSKRMVEDLKKIGMFQRKSLTLKFPSFDMVPKNLMPHFIRGAFDGDGCISVTKPKSRGCLSAAVSFVGSEFFMDGISSFLNNELHIASKIFKIKHSNGAFSFSFTKQSSLKSFYNYIYHNSELFLTRKKEKFEFFFKSKKIDLTSPPF